MEQIPFHRHQGTDAPKIKPEDLDVLILDTVPTDLSPDGAYRLYYDGTDYRVYFRINNTWKGVALTL